MNLRRPYGVLVDLLSLPLTALFRHEAGAEYGVGRWEKLQLVSQTVRAQKGIPTASNFLEHLAMAGSILRVPRSIPGAVIECGCYKGGSTAGLSLACRLTNRRLLVFDSFAGLPEPSPDDAAHYVPRDRASHTYERGAFGATLAEVERNVSRFGAPEVCEFRSGYFESTLPELAEQCVFAFVDVDLTESVKTCLQYIWPLLVDGGELWSHEADHAAISALFFDTQWWGEALGVPPPGLIGAGSGLNLSSHWGTPIGYTIKNPKVMRVLAQE